MVAILLETNGADPQDLQQRWNHLQFNLFSILNCSAVLVFGTTLSWIILVSAATSASW
ncbi:hypothetical protein HPP92_023406 [Vanilla planifolia]|uniref:Uncharacterized protein n=1 Tax=Vanilla planifolia TaxID=51239 RepID=A0A835PV93_VANPL|nr:hypothetical protein HPP92_023406 [Vanilla planifolia]